VGVVSEPQDFTVGSLLARIRVLEARLKFCRDIAEEEYPHQRDNVAAELVLRHIIRKTTETP
jgi:hypothetical protein